MIEGAAGQKTNAKSRILNLRQNLQEQKTLFARQKTFSCWLVFDAETFTHAELLTRIVPAPVKSLISAEFEGSPAQVERVKRRLNAFFKQNPALKRCVFLTPLSVLSF